MAYDRALAERVSALLESRAHFQPKHMFGGIAYMLDGNMALGVLGDDLIVRVGLARYQQALEEPGAQVFATTGKPMAGWVAVAPQGTAGAGALEKWIDLALSFVSTLPAK